MRRRGRPLPSSEDEGGEANDNGGHEGWMRPRGRDDEGGATNDNGNENQETQNNNNDDCEDPKSKCNRDKIRQRDLDFAARINAIPNKAWVADGNLFSGLTHDELQHLAGTIIHEQENFNGSRKKRDGAESENTRFTRQGLPREFDSRKQWPQCAKLMSVVRDQSGCRSCWAVSLGSVTTDRLCIQRAKQGLPIEEILVSEADILTCSGAGGCEEGGLLGEAVKWMSKNLVISGGPYRDGGCEPYPFPPRMWSTEYSTPKCTRTCQASFRQTYAQSKNDMHIKAIKPVFMTNIYKDFYQTSERISEQRMMREIMTNGPIVSAIVVYKDFTKYSSTSGIYNYISDYENDKIGGHALRLIGWGEGPNYSGKVTKYWIGINSWNTDWGQRGVFFIRRGTNEVGIESLQVAFPHVELASVRPSPTLPPPTNDIIINKIPSTSRPISLKSSANFNYVTAWPDGRTLTATSGTVGPWEKFELFPNFRGTNYAVLLAKSNGKYVVAGPALKASTDEPHIGLWNYFLIENMRDGTFALKAVYHNKYVSSEISNGSRLMASRQQPSKWEQFWIENYQQIPKIPQVFSGTIHIKAKNNQKYLATCNNLICASGQSEPFVVVRNTDDTVSLRTATGRYVMADQRQAGKLTLFSLVVGEWERFYVKDMGDGTYALQAKVSKKYVSTELNHGAQLAANRDLPDAWEKFYIEGSSNAPPGFAQLNKDLNELINLLDKIGTQRRVPRGVCQQLRNTASILVEDASNSEFYGRTSFFAGNCDCPKRGELTKEFYKGNNDPYGMEGLSLVCGQNFTNMCICTENGECFTQNEFNPVQLSIEIRPFCEENECHNYVYVIGELIGDRGTKHTFFEQTGPLELTSPYLKAAAVSCTGCENIRGAIC